MKHSAGTVLLCFVLLAGCGGADRAAEAPRADEQAVVDAPDTDAIDSADAVTAGEPGGDGGDAMAAQQDEIPPNQRSYIYVEFKEPFTDADLEWLAGYGLQVQSRTSDRAVVMWFGAEVNNEWTTDERIAKTRALMRQGR